MDQQGINLFIVDDNKLLVTGLRHYLEDRFGADVKITTFNDGESCLEKVDANTNLVILDYFMEGKNGLEILKSIKAINPKTEVVMLSGNEDMALAVESFRHGAKDYVIKGNGSWKKLTKLVYHVITEPVRLLVREFGVSKYVAIFLSVFFLMGVVVFTVMYATR
jgi:two-component system response regulator AtoC